MNLKKYFGLALLLITLLTGCNNNITGLSPFSQTQTQTQQTKPSIEQFISPPTPDENQISIGTFNIQIFGKTKREKEDVVNKLVDIVDDYNIIAVQEFRDKEQKTIPFFLNKINENNNYNVIASERLGRSSAKERYAFYYDKNKIKYLNISFTYPDENDVFEREPFIAYFKTKNGNFDFLLANIHTQPKNATKEINALVEVFNYMQLKHPDEKDIIIIGDFNADGSYYDEDDSKLPLENKKYFWSIPDSFDTTMAKSDNTYDRIVFLKDKTFEDYAGKSGVDRLDKRYSSLNEKELKAISDHHPVWALFYTNKDSD